MNIGGFEYSRCTKSMVCPICERTKYCMVAQSGDAVICTKVSEGRAKHYSFGDLHFINGKQIVKHVRKDPVYKPNSKYIAKVWKGLIKNCDALEPMARHLSIKWEVLSCMHVGYHPVKDAYGFPMYDIKGQMCGIKMRNIEGAKWCIKHSRLGIYRYVFYDDDSGPLIVCEGESDTAAMANLGFRAIGRASATTCNDIVKAYDLGKPIYVVADTDEDGLGLREATKLADSLTDGYVIHNPDYKDVRKWIESGTFTKDLFYAHIQIRSHK